MNLVTDALNTDILLHKCLDTGCRSRKFVHEGEKGKKRNGGSPGQTKTGFRKYEESA